MSQFEVIKDIGETVKELLKNSFVKTGFTTVSVNIEKPKKDNIKNLPTVSAYMFNLAFAPGYKERTQHLVTTQTKDGKIVEYYQDAPLYMHANYIVSVFGNTPGEENLLIGLAVKTFLENPILEGDLLKGDSFFPDDKLNVYPNLQADFNDVLSFWRSLNEEVRPSLFYYVKFRIESDKKSDEIIRVTGREVSIK
ncbi:MAG: DUF4255 domain-containing protein [Deltaproteobacteria bacterium]|nr:DUF4255 domain-containing protein [Deltaproteobacteria bacterium]